jgi:hypothetical protein
MQLTLRQQITQCAHLLLSQLFPVLEQELGEISETGKRLIAVLSLIPLPRFIPSSRGWMGRPCNRTAIARAFVAKAVYNFDNTRSLLDRLASDATLRTVCGWKYDWQIPHESTFSRAFAEFAEMQLPQFVHETLIRETQKNRLVGHIARDATDIRVRETVAETSRQRSPGRSRSRGRVATNANRASRANPAIRRPGWSDSAI